LEPPGPPCEPPRVTVPPPVAALAPPRRPGVRRRAVPLRRLLGLRFPQLLREALAIDPEAPRPLAAALRLLEHRRDRHALDLLHPHAALEDGVAQLRGGGVLPPGRVVGGGRGVRVVVVDVDAAHGALELAEVAGPAVAGPALGPDDL